MSDTYRTTRILSLFSSLLNADALVALQAAGGQRPGHASARAGQAPQARVSPPTEGTRPSELAPTELDDSAMFRPAKPAPDPKPKPGPAAAPMLKPGGSMRDALPQLRKVCAPGALIELVGRARARACLTATLQQASLHAHSCALPYTLVLAS